MVVLVLIVLIVAVVTIFSVQNAVPVTVSFMVWRFSSSLAVLIFLSILVGMLIAILFLFSLRLRKSFPRRARRGADAGAGKMTQDRRDAAGKRPG